MKNKVIYMLLFTVFIMAAPLLSFAQTGPPDPCDQGCPIDGGLSFLLAAGVGYGVKKYREGRNKIVEDAELGIMN